MEVPLGVTVLEAEIRVGAGAGCALRRAGKLWEVSGKGEWKADAGLSDQGGRGLPGGDSGKEEKRENSQRGIFKKREFPARFTGEKDSPGKTGDWGKKVRMGTTAGCGIWGRGNS